MVSDSKEKAIDCQQTFDASQEIYTVRRFRDDDAGEVSALVIKTLKISNIKDYPVEMLEKVAKRFTAEDIVKRAGETHFYVVCDNENVIGCGAIAPHEGKKDESGLLNIFVLPEYQGKGIGRKIMETLEQDEYFLRARRAELAASLTGCQFYRKLGYDYKDGIDKPDEELLIYLEKYRSL